MVNWDDQVKLYFLQEFDNADYHQHGIIMQIIINKVQTMYIQQTPQCW